MQPHVICVVTILCANITLKPATTTMTNCVIVDRTWHVAPKQPGLKSGRLCCFGGPSTDGLSTTAILFTTVNQLKQAIVIEWGKLSQRLVDRAIAQWRRWLECIVQQQSGHIEHWMWKLRDVAVTLDNNWHIIKLTRPPGTVVLGRPYALQQFFLYFLPPDLRAPSADRREILPHDEKCVGFYNQCPKIMGPAPHKKWGGQKHAKVDPICTTSDFDREYLRNVWRYSKSVN